MPPRLTREWRHSCQLAECWDLRPTWPNGHNLRLTADGPRRNALEHGWPADDQRLGGLDGQDVRRRMAAMLKKAADLPTSPFDDVRNMTILASDSSNRARQ